LFEIIKGQRLQIEQDRFKRLKINDLSIFNRSPPNHPKYLCLHCLNEFSAAFSTTGLRRCGWIRVGVGDTP